MTLTFTKMVNKKICCEIDTCEVNSSVAVSIRYLD